MTLLQNDAGNDINSGVTTFLLMNNIGHVSKYGPLMQSDGLLTVTLDLGTPGVAVLSV